MSRRVVITGVGIVSPVGADVGSVADNLLSVNSGIKEIKAYNLDGFKCVKGAYIDDYTAEDHYSDKEIKLFDRATQFGLIAANEAILQSALEIDSKRMGIVIGVGAPAQDTTDAVFKKYYNNERMHPLTVLRGMPNALSAHLSIKYKIKGPAITVSTACASGNHAFIQAYQMIKSGMIDSALTGGADAPFTHSFHTSWEALRVLSSDTCRPFSVDRKGFVFGEGAGMIVMESLDSALSRGANILAEIKGAGMTTDAGDIVFPDKEGMSDCMEQAINASKLSSEDITYISAHGTGTIANDANESAAIQRIFSKSSPYVTSTKSLHGHAFGASPALEMVISVISLVKGFIPATICEKQAEDCNINLVANKCSHLSVDNVLSNSFAFGGINTSIVLGQLD